MKDHVLIVGGGMMGCGICTCSLLAGNRTTVVETAPQARQSVAQRVKACLQELVDNGLATPQTLTEALSRLTVSDDLAAACPGAELVIEAIVEQLEAKQALFAELDRLLPPQIPIASNTSGLRISDIVCRTVHPERMATAHFWFPGHLVPLVEVVMGERTEERYALQLRDILRSWGKVPVLVRKDLPGQLANRILQAVIREAINIVELGIASAEDVDTAVKMGMGIRMPVWGPLEHIEAVGLDLGLSVQRTVLPEISGSPQPAKLLQTMVERGELGYKSGSGFYHWDEEEMARRAAQRNHFIIEACKFMHENNTF